MRKAGAGVLRHAPVRREDAGPPESAARVAGHPEARCLVFGTPPRRSSGRETVLVVTAGPRTSRWRKRRRDREFLGNRRRSPLRRRGRGDPPPSAAAGTAARRRVIVVAAGMEGRSPRWWGADRQAGHRRCPPASDTGRPSAASRRLLGCSTPAPPRSPWSTSTTVRRGSPRVGDQPAMSGLLYFDCFSGIAGDMAAAALLSLSGAEAALRKALRGLPLSGYAVQGGVGELRRRGRDAGPRQRVRTQAHGRRLPDIIALLRASSLPGEVRARAISCFERWGRRRRRSTASRSGRSTSTRSARSTRSSTSCPAVSCSSTSAPEGVLASSLPGGSGEPDRNTGNPRSGPATLELLGTRRGGSGGGRGAGDADGAALLRAFDVSFGRPPVMTVRGVGTGLGHREIRGGPTCCGSSPGTRCREPPGGTASSRSRRTSTT